MQNYIVFLTILSAILMLAALLLCILLANQKATIDSYKEIIEEYRTYIKGLNGNEKL